MNRFLAALSLVSLLSGCFESSETFVGAAKANPSASTTNYTLVISPTFNEDEVADMVAAATAWEQSVPVKFNLKVADSYCPSTDTICVSIGTSTQRYNITDAGVEVRDDAGPFFLLGFTDWDFKDGEATVSMDQLPATVGDKVFTVSFMHELGHALGLVHHTGCHLMNPVIDLCAVLPVDDDVSQWWSIRDPNLQ